MRNSEFKHNRAKAGGKGYAASRRRRAPLRKVVMELVGGMERLECGHEIYPPRDMIGRTNANARRCLKCLMEKDQILKEEVQS